MFVWVAGILLFVAMGFFAFAQGAVARNGAQTAADSAALAAGQVAREGFKGELARAIADEGAWEEVLNGKSRLTDGNVQSAAEQLAGKNGAHLIGAVSQLEHSGAPAFSVEVQSDRPVGKTIISGIGGKHAKAQAIAVVEPRCSADGEGDSLVLACGGSASFPLDLDDFVPGDLPDASEMFSVHLVG